MPSRLEGFSSVSHGQCSEWADSLFNPGMPDGMIDLYMTSVLRRNAELTWVTHTHVNHWHSGIYTPKS